MDERTHATITPTAPPEAALAIGPEQAGAPGPGGPDQMVPGPEAPPTPDGAEQAKQSRVVRAAAWAAGVVKDTVNKAAELTPAPVKRALNAAPAAISRLDERGALDRARLWANSQAGRTGLAARVAVGSMVFVSEASSASRHNSGLRTFAVAGAATANRYRRPPTSR